MVPKLPCHFAAHRPSDLRAGRAEIQYASRVHLLYVRLMMRLLTQQWRVADSDEMLLHNDSHCFTTFRVAKKCFAYSALQRLSLLHQTSHCFTLLNISYQRFTSLLVAL